MMFILGGVLTLIILGGGSYYIFYVLAQPREAISTSQSTAPYWDAASEPAKSTGVSGKVYGVSGAYEISATMHIQPQPLMTGWKVSAENGSANETIKYKATSGDEKSTLTTLNAASTSSRLFTSLEECTKGLVERYASVDMLTQFDNAIPGTVKTGEYKTYTVAMENGEGLSMGMVVYSYTDTENVAHSEARLLRCGTNNILSVVLSAGDEKALSTLIDAVLPVLIVKGV